MEIKLFNTMSRKKELFKPIKKDEVGFYGCGPTVYNYAHIGNLRKYILDDLINRMFRYNHFKVNYVMNVTDVGHLSSDADSGEDKIKKQAEKEKKSAYDIARFYEDRFFEDTAKLNILKPDVTCRATEHIKEIINLIKKIEKNGYTYLSGGNLYFDVSKFKDYGKLARLKMDELKAGARIEVDKNKKNPFDFVLWFTESKFKNQEMLWESPWGIGYPGWHIECSAMSIEYLGNQFDIHTGGIDHINVHHTNEIAQSEAATGKKPWVKCWIHSEFLVADKGKMSKSSGEFLTLQILINKGYDPLDYRYFCLNTHYRKPLMFSFEALDSARNARERLNNKILEIRKNVGYSHKTKNDYSIKFKESVNDDLNLPKALAVLWKVLDDPELGDREKYDLVMDFDSVLGLGLEDLEEKTVELNEKDKKLILERETARKNKDWKKADEIRNIFIKKGYILKDTPKGVKVEKSNI
ncbi:MAG: cysteine--tRNA ligase [Candidatus Nanoarchaeia archaeon]|nr:cysteine--tRNA ligase [Candidatus Nanoarchaeia archaeon]